MLIPPEKLSSLYEQIIKNALGCEGQGTSIYIFVSNEADSLCALKMLTVISYPNLTFSYRLCLNQTKCSITAFQCSPTCTF